MNGYWCICPVIGYSYEEIDGHGKMLVPEEPIAGIVRDALEGYASGRFESVVEVQRFLQAQPAFARKRKGKVHYQSVYDMLTRSIYAGYIDVPKWNLSLHPGKHEPLISFETWQKIQDRLKGKAKAPARKDIHEDFPLRGFIPCGCYGKPMTAAWPKGRNKKYPYYFCQTKGCSERSRSIRKEKIEGEFVELLKEMRPSPGLFQIAFEMLRELWDDRLAKTGDQLKAATAEIIRLERKSEQLMERLVAADSPALMSA